MTDQAIKIYPYRWVVLALFMFVNLMVQVLWICYAPVASIAAGFYNVKKDDIDLLANIFLIVYLPVAFPAAWAIDKFGIHKGVGFGAILMAVFAMLRALFPADYTMALIGSIGIAIGQPFLLSAFTKTAALWFPQAHRATITGLMFLALFVGVAIGEVVPPILVGSGDIGHMEMVFGVLSLASALLFLVFARAKPKTPPGTEASEIRASMMIGLKSMLKDKDVYIISILILVGSAVVNGILTLIDGISAEKHLTSGQGIWLVSAILAGGIVGSVVVPMISDGIKRRKAILIASGVLGGILSIAIALVTDFGPVMVVSFLLGVMLTGVVPLAYQYGAEITHPTPEGTSNGWLGLVLQAAGFLILAMDMIKNAMGNSYMPAMIGLGALLLLSTLLLTRIRESPEVQKG